MAALGVTLGFSIVFGAIFGWFTSLPFFQPPKELFEDTEHWYDKEILDEYFGEISFFSELNR